MFLGERGTSVSPHPHPTQLLCLETHLCPSPMACQNVLASQRSCGPLQNLSPVSVHPIRYSLGPPFPNYGIGLGKITKSFGSMALSEVLSIYFWMHRWVKSTGGPGVMCRGTFILYVQSCKSKGREKKDWLMLPWGWHHSREVNILLLDLDTISMGVTNL